MKLKKIFEAGGASSGKFELVNTDVNTAIEYAKELGIDISKIPNFKQNYLYAQKLAKLGKASRKDMPVIDTSDVKEFQHRLANGFIDIYNPYSNNTDKKRLFPQGLNGKEAADFLKRGTTDGSVSDDIIKSKIIKISVKKLKPIQKQIYYGNSIGSIARHGKENALPFYQNHIFVISNDNYIIDGHHRFLSMILLNPNAQANALQVDLPLNSLLPLAQSYGDAIGNKRNQ